MNILGKARVFRRRAVTLLVFARHGADGSIGSWSPGGYELPPVMHAPRPRSRARLVCIRERDADGFATVHGGRSPRA